MKLRDGKTELVLLKRFLRLLEQDAHFKMYNDSETLDYSQGYLNAVNDVLQIIDTKLGANSNELDVE